MSGNCEVAGCENPARTEGLCRNHRRRMLKYGDPLAGRVTNGGAREFMLRIIETYDGDECVRWPYSVRGDGRGQINVNGKPRLVHRVICEAVNGPPPTEHHEAAHSCGNGHLSCITPRHLRWATRKENAQDMQLHGTVLAGEKNPMNVIDLATAIQVRVMAKEQSQAEISRALGIPKSTVGRIVRREDWTSRIDGEAA